ncbi:tyrosine decarboxylase 1-like [Vicia villosa]|uniref:tyrosine decarboxylase 1-like n=1 Tax=Vicia villosa TaxID=3911 RepID=UPI00273C8BC3|nr:tyrosine decarboxylase 1-like [Vicia villosa]
MNPLDLEEFKRQGYMMIDFLTDYYKNIENYPVLSKVEPGYLAKKLPSSPPFEPESIESILEDVQQHIIPGITHWMSPNYYAYFPSSGSIAGFVGEMLSNGFNVVGFNWLSSPAATELETIVMNWLAKMLNLPKCFIFSSNFKDGGGGVLLGTTCEAILCTLVAARDEKLSKIGKENIGKLVVYCSDQTHSALQKATQIVGIHAQNFRVIKTKGSNFFSLSHESFLSTILLDVENGLVPCFLCATVGTTATNAIDPIKLLCNVAKEYDIWVHVDAAYAGSACICPEFRHYIDGIEDVNSFSFNAHKWFLTNLACCCLWVKDHSALTKSLSTYPEYLRNINSDSKQVIDYKDWQIPLSRKFNSLKLWIVIRSYGVENLKKFLRNHVEMAKTFEGLVRKDERFEIVVPTRFALVCFRISPSAINISNESGDCYYIGKMMNDGYLVNEVYRKLLDSVNGSGKAYMSHCEVDGAFVIRCAIGSTLTEEHHVTMTWKLVQQHASFLLGNKQACDTQT